VEQSQGGKGSVRVSEERYRGEMSGEPENHSVNLNKLQPEGRVNSRMGGQRNERLLLK
jgi:hypothetical protein